MLNLGRYRIIEAPCEVLIPSKKRQKTHKLTLKTKPGRFFNCIKFKNLFNIGTS